MRELYEQLLKAMHEFGPLSVFPVKTRIVFQAEVQLYEFAAHDIPKKSPATLREILH